MLVISTVVVGLSVGCSYASPPTPDTPASVARAAAEPRELPSLLEELDLGTSQRDQILSLFDEVKRDLTPLVDSGREFGRALSVAARQCKGDSPFIEMQASSTAAVGEQIREPVLDAIQRLHGILTPAQRRALSRRLLGADQPDERERKNDTRTRSLGIDLDLSVGQMLSMLLRVQALRESFQERAEPWRLRYRSALRAFARDDFDVRRHPIAEAPLVALATTFVRDALRVLMPVLEPAQCETLGRFIADKVDD